VVFIAAPSPGTKLKAAALITLTALLLTLGLEISGALAPFRLKTLDILFRRVPLAKASPEVVVVTVDQADMDFFKNQGIVFPWPRRLYGPLIDYCQQSGARAVILDLLLATPSAYGPEDDYRLAQAFAAAGNVVLPFLLSREETGANVSEAALLQKAGLQIPGPGPRAPVDYRSVLTPVGPLLDGAQALGNVEANPDADGIYRRVPLVVLFKDRWLPTLSFAAFLQFGSKSFLKFDGNSLLLGDRRIPLDAQGCFLLKFRGPTGSHKRFSAANVISSEARVRQGLPPIYPREAFAGKWVLVGCTAPGQADLKASPVAAVYPGVEFHATLLDNLLQGDFLKTLPDWSLWVWALTLAAAMAAAVLFSARLTVTLAALGLAVLVCLALSVLAFRAGRWADPILPGITLALSFSLATAYSYANEGRQKTFIRGMFGQYMSENIINHLLAHPEKLKLGGERRRVTLFFSDLADFTTISEHLEAETVVALLNDYFSCMTEIILAEGGTMDKFEGDAIMAFWGAPLDQEDQSLRACRAARRQQAALEGLNRRFAEQKLPPLLMRIGLHTGEAIVGNLGSAKHLNYTVIGDTVNLAARLEGLNKFYRTAIIASEAMVLECGEAIIFRELDLVAVKGRETPVRVFEVLALKEEMTLEMEARGREFAQSLDLYRRGDFSGAAMGFAALLKRFPADGPARAFLERCRRHQETPPPADWDLVFRPDYK
jgi:adenylate cyclase